MAYVAITHFKHPKTNEMEPVMKILSNKDTVKDIIDWHDQYHQDNKHVRDLRIIQTVT